MVGSESSTKGWLAAMASILRAIQTAVDPHKESCFLFEPWLVADLAMHVQLFYFNKMPCACGNG